MRIIYTLIISLFLIPSTTVTASSFSSTSLPVNSGHADPDPATIKAAILALKNMPRKERRAKLKHAKQEIKAFRAAKKRGEDVDTNTVLLVVLAIFLPPVAVYLHDNAATTRFWITLALFILGVAGAFIFGWWAVLLSIIFALIIVLGGA